MANFTWKHRKWVECFTAVSTWSIVAADRRRGPRFVNSPDVRHRPYPERPRF